MQLTENRMTERIARAALALILALGLTLPTAALMVPGQAWAEGEFTVSFDTNGGSGTAINSITQGSLGAPITLPAKPDWTKTDYTIDGWSKTQNGVKDFEFGGNYTPSATETLYAHWALNGKVTIRNIQDNATPFKAYQVFTATIGDDDKATNVTWTTDSGIVTAVKTYLDAHGYLEWLCDTMLYTSTKVSYNDLSAADKASHDSAQNAAEYINYAIRQSGDDKDDTSPGTGVGFIATPRDNVPSGNSEAVYSKLGTSFAWGLADALKNCTATDISTTSGSATFEAVEGFYLIVAGTSRIDDAGTAPIWLPLGGSTTAITEKTALVTTDKYVANDQASNSALVWSKAADANVGQYLWYRLSGTLPANIKSFPKYHYTFEDQLTAGFDVDPSSITVVAYGPSGSTEAADVMASDTNSEAFATPATAYNISSSATTKTYNANNDYKVVVDIPDLLAVDLNGNDSGVPHVERNYVIAVYYKAKLLPASGSTNQENTYVVYGKGGAEATNLGNVGSSLLKYTSNPIFTETGGVAPADGWTSSVPTSTYTYKLELGKYDKGNGRALQGVKFRVQVHASSNTDNDSKGKFLNLDGSINDSATENTAAEFVTDAYGKFVIWGIDEGVYTLIESDPTNGYAKGADITLTVNPALDANDRTLSTATVITSGGVDANVSVDKDLKTRPGTYTPATGTSAASHGLTDSDIWSNSSGQFDIITVNERQILMPLTGLPGYVGLAILGLVLVVGGFGGIFALRRARDRKAASQFNK